MNIPYYRTQICTVPQHVTGLQIPVRVMASNVQSKNIKPIHFAHLQFVTSKIYQHNWLVIDIHLEFDGRNNRVFFKNSSAVHTD